MFNPLCAKSRIVALDNHEDRIWAKSDKYAPVLRPNLMHLLTSMAVKKHCTLKQGDCKNAFCQGILPDDKITIIKPPIGDPDAEKDKYWLLKRMIYGLRRSPKHWYTKIKSIFDSIGLQENASDPCLITGHVLDPSNPVDLALSSPLTLGLFIDNFVYFLEDPAKHKFETLLSTLVTIEFMGMVDWFLGIHFQWLATDNIVSVNLSQTGFAAPLVKDNNIHTCDIAHDATSYHFGLPLTPFPNQMNPMIVPPLLNRSAISERCRINWLLAQSTCPDLAPTHSFLLAYCNKPSRSHWNAALYALHYIHSTIDYGFTFTSNF
jgi:hypothetical protein